MGPMGDDLMNRGGLGNPSVSLTSFLRQETDHAASERLGTDDGQLSQPDRQ